MSDRPSGAAPAVPVLTDERLGQVIRERALWENNRLGITDKIPPPWTPMTVKGKTVGVWGRTITLGADGLPRPELFVADQLHFSPAGYRLLAERVRTFLAN